MARLDRLGAAKEVAQIGAAIGREFSHALLAAVVHKPEAELASALDRLIDRRFAVPAGRAALCELSVQACPGTGCSLWHVAARASTLASRSYRRNPRKPIRRDCREPARAVARHCTEAGLIEKAAGLWGKAGQRSLERSALVEAAAQFTRALDQIAALPATPALRREQIRLQVALIAPLLHVRGHAAPETKAAAERARLLIEQAEALGEAPEDPLLLFSVLYSCLASELHSVPRRRDVRACEAVPGVCREARSDCSAPDSTPHHGHFLAVYGRYQGRQNASRSGNCALRSCRASSARDAF